LVKRVDAPKRALREDAVLIECNQLSERFRSQTIHHDGVGGPIAFEHPVRDEPIGRAFGFDLLARFSEGERLGLRKYVRQQHIVMPPERIERRSEGDEVAGNEARPLMDQLIERVLAVGSGLAPVDRTSLVVHRRAGERHVLAVALHGQLLEISREALEVLVVGQHRDGLRAEEVVVPDAEQTHEHRQVTRERRASEMLASMVESPIAESIE
jgi:hypothetical protein